MIVLVCVRARTLGQHVCWLSLVSGALRLHTQGLGRGVNHPPPPPPPLEQTSFLRSLGTAYPAAPPRSALLELPRGRDGCGRC